jgi:hypothetical protein
MPMVRYIGLAAIQARGMEAVRKATVDSAEDLVAKTSAEAPVDEGTLSASIHVAEVNQSGTTVEAIVATGAEASAYAIYQHEGMRADGTHVIRNGGNPKYMERPLLAHGPTYRAAIAKAAAGAY